MKKICMLISCLLLIQMLCACVGKKDDFKDPVNFFFCSKEISYNSPTGVIYPEIREGAGFHGNLAAMLRAYFYGPNRDDLKRPVPAEVYMVSCEQNGNIVTIVMCSQFSKVTGVDLSTTCSALLMTVHDFTGADTIKISAKDAQLDDKNEIILSLNDIILIDAVK